MTYTNFVKSVESISWHQPNERLLHAAMGLCTETAELYELESEQHELEELGDICWYVALGLDALGSSWEEIQIMDGEEFVALVRGNTADESVMIYATDLLDMMKKNIFYGRPVDTEKAFGNLVLIKNCLHWGLVAGGSDLTLDQVVDANIKKLTARFPEKFTEDAANNRDVKAEYAAMSR